MTDYGTAFLGPQSQTVTATDYVYTWINRNEGPARAYDMSAYRGSGNAIFFDFTPTTKMVWDGTRWITPGFVWDTESGAWVPYGLSWDGTMWV